MAALADQLVTGLALAWEHRGWLVVAAFLVGLLAEQLDREWGRRITVGAWLSFAIYGASMIPYFFFEQMSVIEGVGSVLVVPVAGAIAYHLWNGRDSLFVLSRAVAVAGLLFLPVTALEVLRRPLIETVTDQTDWLINLLGFEPDVVAGMTLDPAVYGTEYQITAKEYPYESTFVFDGESVPITYTIAIACTGLGSIAVFGGLILAVSAPAGRKLRALAVSVPVIYGLNLVRNVFIAVGFGEQYFHVFPGAITWLFGLESSTMVSYIVADRIIAQSASVVALVGITWLVVRELPEVVLVVEDALFVVTGRELDLAEALGIDEDGTLASPDAVQPDPSD